MREGNFIDHARHAGVVDEELLSIIYISHVCPEAQSTPTEKR